ncbi:hypothetical protein GEMRC1_001979 [Eukaryota sp. GEM-RC1]
MDAHTVNNIDLEFPLLCSSCLGPSQYLQMVRRHAHSSCRTCERPYTSFRWKPGATARYKHTVVCATCARGQNVCQCCLLDLDLAISTSKRDALLGQKALPTSRKGKEYVATLAEHREHSFSLTGDLSSLKPATSQRLLPNAELRPDYSKNKPKTCSFWLKGNCARGSSCPYLHEKSETIQSSSIEERFYGVKKEDRADSKSLDVPLPHELSEDVDPMSLFPSMSSV